MDRCQKLFKEPLKEAVKACLNCEFCGEEFVEDIVYGGYKHKGFVMGNESVYCRRKMAAKLKELTPETIKDKISLVKKLSGEIVEWKKKTFPKGTKVRVDCDRYKGPAEILYGYAMELPVDKIAVKLSNDGVWWYSVLDCKVV